MKRGKWNRDSDFLSSLQKWLQREHQGHRADYLCGTELPDDTETHLLVVSAGGKAFYSESVGLKGASVWLSWSVTGDNDQEHPAADGDQQERAEQSLGRSCAQGQVSSS